MRSVSALDVRKHFGQLLDEAARGERLIIERAGQPIAALVPLSDVPELDRDARIRRRREAIRDIARFARQMPADRSVDAAELIRQQRRQRTEQIVRRTGRPDVEP
jgi:prevent-host-death family protein